MKNKIISRASVRSLICCTKGPAKCSRWFAYLKALAFLGVYFCAVPLPAQTEAGPRARITFADGTSVTIRGHDRNEKVRLQPVAILAGERVNIQLKLPSRFANTFMAVQALDGGLASGDVLVAADGSAAIAFQGGVQPGLYRILLSAGGKSATLQFSIPNPGTP